MPSFKRAASVQGVARGVACATDDILSGAVCTLTTSRGIKTLTHLKRPPGLRGVLREDPRAGLFPPTSPFALARALSSPLPILRCSNLHPPRSPFSVPAQTTTPIAPSFPPPHPLLAVVLLSATLALSTGLPRPPASIASRPRGSPADPTNLHSASRDSLFFRANGNRTHPSSAFPPSASSSSPPPPPLPVFTLAPLPALPANCSQHFPWAALFLSLFSSSISPFPHAHWSVD